MKARLLPMALATFLILVVLLVGVLTDFIGTDLLAGPEPGAVAVLTTATDMAPAGVTPVMLSLADVVVAPDAIDNTSSRQATSIGMVRFPLKFPQPA